MNFGKMKFALKNAVIASIVLNNWEKQLGLNSENGTWKNKLEFDENLKVRCQQEPLMSTGASHVNRSLSCQQEPLNASIYQNIFQFKIAWDQSQG